MKCMRSARLIVAGMAVSVLGAIVPAYGQTTLRPASAGSDWGWGDGGSSAPAVTLQKPAVIAPEAASAPAPTAAPRTKAPSLLAPSEDSPDAGDAANDVKQQMRDALKEATQSEAAEAPPEETKAPPAPEAVPAAKEEDPTPATKAPAKEPAREEKETPAPQAMSVPSAANVSAEKDPFVGALVATYKDNPRIKAERERQKATDEGVAQALSGFRPTVTAGYDKGRQRTAFNGAAWSYGKSEDKSLSVEQPLFRGFGTISGYQSAKQRVKAGAFQLSATEQRVLLQAIAAYMDVVSDASILDLARNNRDVLQKQLDASNERFNVGEVTRTDVAQSEARLSQAKTQVISAEGRLISSVAEFERVVGYKPEGTLPTPQSIPELPATLKEALEQAQRANPELLSAVHSAKSSEFDVLTRQSTILPRVSLVGTMNRQEGAGVLGTSTFDQDSLTVQVNVPLYQSGAEYSRVREAKKTARQRSEQAIDARMAVDEEVTKAWEQLETAINTISTRNDQIKAAEIALDGVKQEQEYGARTILDVLDAEQELFVARSNLVGAQRDRVVAAYNVLLTLGRLTPGNLGLPVAQYDPSENYRDIKWLPAGF